MPKLTKMGYESEVAFRLSHLKLPSWNPSLDFMPSVNLGLSGCWCRRPGPRTYFRVRCTRGLPLAKNQFEKVRDIYKRITWNLKKPFINLQMVVSISWFQIFPWEMVVSSNVHFKRVVWSSRYLYYRREGGYSGAQCCLGTRADSLRYRTPRPALVTLWWHGTLHLGSSRIQRKLRSDDGWWWMMMDDDGWWWMMMDDDGWWWMMMDDDGWWWMMMDDDGWWWMGLGCCHCFARISGLDAIIPCAWHHFYSDGATGGDASWESTHPHQLGETKMIPRYHEIPPKLRHVKSC